MQESIWACYQQQLWIQAPLKDGLEMNAESYGFTFVKQQDYSSWYCYPQPEDLPSLHVVNAPTRMDMSLQRSWDQVLQILQV